MARPQLELPADAPGVPARRAALKLLDAVLRQGKALEAALDRAAANLPANDRGLAHAIAAEVLRFLSDLDALIDSATRNRIPDDAKARFALRIALAQVLRLGTPPHAAISTVLPLVDGGPRKLVHGVFGALMRQGVSLPDTPALPDVAALRWEAQHGSAMVEAAMAAIAQPPATDLTLADPAATDEWVAKLEGVSLFPGHVRLPAGKQITALPGFDAGAWWVQDLAASLPARLLGQGAGDALDLCAAPGGKTLQLASQGWRTIAVDMSESRLARLRDNLGRTRIDAEIVCADLREWKPAAPVDAVLLDAPCSATGIFRRHPDVLHRVRPSVIAETAGLQRELLGRAAEWVRVGGRLVYAVCSLERPEGEEQIADFLSRHRHFAIDPVNQAELPAGVAPNPDGTVRTLPGMLIEQGGLDGFFIARMIRTA
ncbi:RsmB/NOP family class I SAM-dependent RNA methyltransferase [Sphingomonas qomolangmaensis]|uniref:RsmB/NOP family class I SAM-dependent RNA methyltransferase n=1 Tax=Sphingomonas qomolangmaensis TaxID=2918765 RepID=A0ABY5L6D2_9SPHN|nr:RsmB/NOP family class I SAM-dependent RNA methyltransferase [Sphingomonas qomolangmaensis]UUL81997.1 RsmB/NOP family class I SAM-dependent RNA methyltransferase [Sphingomonas qomolangmaensis]